MMNSLYGKFGQKTRENSVIGECDPMEVGTISCCDDETGKEWTEYHFGGKIYMSEATEKESQHSFPAIAAFCTAYARMRILEAIEACGWENVYYCDTDSIFTNETGRKKLMDAGLVDNKELGKMKLEYWAKDMEIKGCKDYIIRKNLNPIATNLEFINEIVKIKGVPKKAIKIDDNKYEVMKMAKIKSSIKAGVLYGVIQSKGEKVLSREYIKGVVLENGEVEPIRLNESIQNEE